LLVDLLSADNYLQYTQVNDSRKLSSLFVMKMWQPY